MTMSRRLGHLYMNQQKALFSIARNILLQPLPKYVLNFESSDVLDYFFKCADTHRTNQSLEIFLYGTDLQMVYEYVAQTDEEQSTVDGFLKWNPNKTYHVVCQLVFTYALAIMRNKLGYHNNNEKIQSAGRYKFMELFYGFNHPIYQEIEHRDLRQKVVMPTIVKKQRTENLTYTISKNPYKHQGGDIILEGKVRRQKMLASKGVNSEKMWREVARSLDDIDEVSEPYYDILAICYSINVKILCITCMVSHYARMLLIYQKMQKTRCYHTSRLWKKRVV